MKEADSPTLINYFLKPGFIFLAEKPTVISTVLGSGVSVCIYDRKLKTGAMNRFQYPLTSDRTKSTAAFGNVATIAMIRMMEKNGSKRKNLEAQILGGAHNPDISERNIGRENVKTAVSVLMKEGIPIASRDDGGEKGRKVVFNTFTNELLVFKVEKLRASDWYPYEGNR
jgi:chemotaxis protein CheD